MKNNIRIGIGYDVHRLEKGRRLIIGGVEIDYPEGLAGHSDADVLLHAISDALLGALALGDIGAHFPDTDPAYKGSDSRELLRKTFDLVHDKRFELINLDSTVVAQRPRLAPYIDMMRKNIASDLQVKPTEVSIKATTSEQLGFEGAGQGISAQAIVLLKTVNE